MDVVTKGDQYMDAYSSLWFINNYCIPFTTHEDEAVKGEKFNFCCGFSYIESFYPRHPYILNRSSETFPRILKPLNTFTFIFFYSTHAVYWLENITTHIFRFYLYPISLKYLSTFQNKLERTNKPIKIVGSVSNTHQ